MAGETKFHWEEGMKYALEGIKALFILNGAATISILTFAGNYEDGSEQLVSSMLCFAFGAATGPTSLFLAYLTQLMYGNAELRGSKSEGYRKRAAIFHNLTYVSVFLGLVLFLSGVIFAGCALSKP